MILAIGSQSVWLVMVCVCVCVYSGLELTTDVAIWFTIGYSLIGTLAIASALGM
jgi:hypothetical protein